MFDPSGYTLFLKDDSRHSPIKLVWIVKRNTILWNLNWCRFDILIWSIEQLLFSHNWPCLRVKIAITNIFWLHTLCISVMHCGKKLQISCLLWCDVKLWRLLIVKTSYKEMLSDDVACKFRRRMRHLKITVVFMV